MPNLEQDLLAPGLDDGTRLDRLVSAAEHLCNLASHASTRLEDVDAREAAEDFAGCLCDLISATIIPAVDATRHAAQEQAPDAADSGSPHAEAAE